MSLVAFDFDGTLSDSEMTVLLGEQCGVADEMAEITRRSMDGEIEYAESLRRRCRLLEGLPEERALVAFDAVALRPGAADVLRALNEAGVHTAILTGGFERGVEAALEAGGVAVDAVVANRLPVAGGEGESRNASATASGAGPRVLTGEVEGPLIEGTKDDALASLAETVAVEMGDTVAVGDGANDLPMLEVAGLAIGFEPKEAVAPACDVVVHSMAALGGVLEGRGLC